MKITQAIKAAKRIRSLVKSASHVFETVKIERGMLHGGNGSAYLIVPFVDGNFPLVDIHELIESLQVYRVLNGLKSEIVNVSQLELTPSPRGAVPFPDYTSLPSIPVLGVGLSALLKHASVEAERYVLCGVFIDRDGTLSAVDGRRLAVHKRVIPVELPEGLILNTLDIDVLVPGDVDLHVIPRAGKVAAFRIVDSEGNTLYGESIDGQYPDYTKIIPKKWEIEKSVPADVIKNQATAGKIKSTKESPGFDFSVPGVNATYHADFMLDAIAFLLPKGEGDIRLKFTDSVSPILMETNNKQCVVMPIRK